MSQETKVIEKHDVVIRFSGDSGDGMQLTGQQFSDTAALFGNDVATFPDYPAEIRAPQGTVGGVSGFQVHIGEEHITTPGDYADVLVAMNPAALKANLRWAKKAGLKNCRVTSKKQEFYFTDWNRAAKFVTSTGALAGYDAMLDLKNEKIFNTLVEQLQKFFTKPCITHHFVMGIFKKG